MAAQPPFINVKKYTLVGGGQRWRVEKERIMGLSPLGKEEGQKSIFTMEFLGFKWEFRGGKYGKIWKPK